MAEYKYVMFRAGEQDFPVIFPGQLVHADIAALLAPKLGQPVSAGMISALHVLSADGVSDTLKMWSRDMDKRVINMWPYESGRDGGAPGMDKLVAIGFVKAALKDLD